MTAKKERQTFNLPYTVNVYKATEDHREIVVPIDIQTASHADLQLAEKALTEDGGPQQSWDVQTNKLFWSMTRQAMLAVTFTLGQAVCTGVALKIFQSNYRDIHNKATIQEKEVFEKIPGYFFKQHPEQYTSPGLFFAFGLTCLGMGVYNMWRTFKKKSAYWNARYASENHEEKILGVIRENLAETKDKSSKPEHSFYQKPDLN